MIPASEVNVDKALKEPRTVESENPELLLFESGFEMGF